MRKLGVLVALTTASAVVGIAPATAGAQTPPTPEVTAFCDAAITADKATAKLESGKPKQKDIQAAETALSGVESTAPPEIASALQAVVAATRTGLQTGKDPFESDPSAQQSFNQLQEYRFNSCGYPQLDVTGIEYEFQGLPKTVPAGNVAFKFADNGAEIHELMVARIKSKDSAKKIAGLSEKELGKKAEEVGITFAKQGETSYTIADMSKPGRYAVLCHLPVGSTSEKAAEEAGHKHGTKTHAQEGMYAAITVQAGATTTTAAG